MSVVSDVEYWEVRAMVETQLRILLIEDSEAACVLTRICLQDGLEQPFTFENADSLAAGLAKIDEREFDLVLIDLTLPDSMGVKTFKQLRRKAPRLPTVVLTGISSQDMAVQAVRLGAEEFVLKDDMSPETLSRAVRFALERHRRQHVERELTAAHEVQQMLYPAAAPDLPGLEIAGAVWAAEAACGDYFDYIPLCGNTLGIAVGDVTGHGMRAALTMVETRAYLRVLSRAAAGNGNSPDPGEILDELNSLLSGGANPLLVSLFFAAMDPDTQTLLYAGAGQSAFQLRANGEINVLDSTGMLLGMDLGLAIPTAEPVQFQPGDLLLIPTDGIFETRRRDGELFGTARMLETVQACREQSAHEIVVALHKAAREFTDNREQDDDMTVVVVKVT